MRDQTFFSKKVTFLNVMLTFFIVLLHAETPQRFGMPLDKTYPFIYSIFTIVQLGVPMFFFISAVLFFKQCTFADLEKKYKHRVFSLLIPYLLWNTFFVFIYVALMHIPFFQERMHMSPEVLGTPTQIFNAIIHSKCTPLWFVKDLMLLTLLAPVVLLLLRDIRWISVAFVVSIIIALSGNYSYENILVWLPVYLQGAIVGHYSFSLGAYRTCDTYTDNKCVNRVIIAFIIISILVLYICLYVNESFIRIFRYCAPLLVWILIDFILKKYLSAKFEYKPWMSYMFIIYCMHHFILNVLQKIVYLIFPPTKLVLNLTFILTPIIAILFIIIFTRYLSRLRVYKYLSGGR